jgi:hypothetical protein
MTEFDDVIRLLKDERPQATDLELDEIKQRVRRRAADPSRRNQSMKSRLAILGMLVAGLVFSTAGAGLAIQGQSGSNAAVSQYGTPTPTATPVCTPTPSGTVTPTSGGGSVTPSDICGEGGVLPAEEENAPASETDDNNGGTAPTTSGGGTLPAEETETQAERQQAAAAQTSELPFTGFAAIPVLLGGLALLAGGLVLRSRTRSQS